MLQTITIIKDMSLDVETRIRDLQERYRVLGLYDLEVRGTQMHLLRH